MKQAQIKINYLTIHNNRAILKVAEVVLLLILFSASIASASASEITASNILDQINYQRELRGVTPLREDSRLNTAALNKSTNMIEDDYFEHYANGLSPWDFMREQKYDYLYAGENLAMDFKTSEGMVRAWMSSPAHRRNILNPDFEDIGIGVVKGEYSDSKGDRETIMVTNMFGREKPKIIQFFDNVIFRLKSLFR